MKTKSRRSAWLMALLFLGPNLLGFLAFTVIPVTVSLAGSFTTWSLRPAVPLEFIGWENYRELLHDKEFYFYLFNTGYLMLAQPVAIAGSLFFAVVLTGRLDFKQPRHRVMLVAIALAIAGLSAAVALVLGAPGAALFVAILGVLTAIGLQWGSVSYRTFLYLPHFTAGAATILLWTQLYNPNFGILNQLLDRTFGVFGLNFESPGWLTSTKSLLGFLPLPEHFNNGGFGIGAREAVMLMTIWATVGGNNLLLYIAGISNIPTELYEAAELDGANAWQRFRHITWPQLAPTTFFIAVMAVIGGLQGGFEQARLMTQGGPAGTTTTLSYYIYKQGFERLDLAYGSAIAWVLFAVIFALTIVHWRVGKGAAAE